MANATAITPIGSSEATQQSTAMRRVDVAVAQDSGGLNAFGSTARFEAALRVAEVLASSTLVPEAYRENLPNCMLALDMADRIKASVFAVMQNLNIIQGKPSFGSSFLIATVNGCGRFTPLRFRWEGTRGAEDYGCRAVGKDRETGDVLEGTLITYEMAKAEGWLTRNGSKWKSMFDQMCCYRAAAFWQRLYAPELSLGMRTTDEVIDVEGYAVDDAPTGERPGKDTATAPNNRPIVQAAKRDYAGEAEALKERIRAATSRQARAEVRAAVEAWDGPEPFKADVGKVYNETRQAKAAPADAAPTQQTTIANPSPVGEGNLFSKESEKV